MLVRDVPEDVEECEFVKRSATVTDAVGSTHDLESLNANALLIDDDLPSDSEVYFEVREHLDNMAAGRDCVNDHGGRMSIIRDCVNDLVGRQTAISCDAAQILGD